MILYFINQLLRMLNTNTQCKWLGFNEYLVTMEQFKNIPCRMSCCQNSGLTQYLLTGLSYNPSKFA